VENQFSKFPHLLHLQICGMNSNLLPTDLADKADFLMFYYKMPFSNSTVFGEEPNFF